MVKKIIVIVLVIVAGVFAYKWLFESEEKKIKKRFDLLEERVSKTGEEARLETGLKTSQIKTMFTDPCLFEIPSENMSRKFKPQDISNAAMAVISRYSQVSLAFHDLQISLNTDTSARAIGTAQLSGVLQSGERVSDYHEIDFKLKKIDDEWFFSSVTVVEVLEK
jgi:hypothetical protein